MTEKELVDNIIKNLEIRKDWEFSKNSVLNKKNNTHIFLNHKKKIASIIGNYDYDFTYDNGSYLYSYIYDNYYRKEKSNFEKLSEMFDVTKNREEKLIELKKIENKNRFVNWFKNLFKNN